MSEPNYLNKYDYAVVIGIKHYPDFGDLNGPIEDAKRFYDWLIDPESGSVPPCNCQFVKSEIILGDDFPKRPIQPQIDRAFEKVWDKIRDSQKPARRLYFFFNGHGIGVSDFNTALLLADFNLNFFRDSALSSDSYLNRIISSGRFSEIIFLLDCCRNQLLGVSGLNPSFNWPADSAVTGKTATLVGYAAEYQNKAYEAEMEEYAILPQEKDRSSFRGFFTTALLNGLNGAAADSESGKITPESLKNYLEIETPRVANERKRNQQARVNNNFPADTGAFFSVKSFTKEAKYHIESNPSRAGEILLWDGKATLLFSSDTTPLPWDISLGIGLYMLEEKGTDDQRPIKVNLPLPMDITKIIF